MLKSKKATLLGLAMVVISFGSCLARVGSRARRMSG